MAIQYPWFESYKAALLETNRTKIEQRIRVAQAKLQERLRVLSEDHGGTPEERRAVADAINGLKFLFRESSDWPDRQVTHEGTAPSA